MLRRPGIEPGSQEWESCMIPLHQRRTTQRGLSLSKGEDPQGNPYNMDWYGVNS